MARNGGIRRTCTPIVEVVRTLVFVLCVGRCSDALATKPRESVQPTNEVTEIYVDFLRSDRSVAMTCTWCREKKAFVTARSPFGFYGGIGGFHPFHSATSDEDIEPLQTMKQLEWLYLGGTEVTDKGLNVLRDLPNLSHVSLWETEITDAGTRQLVKLPALAELDLSGTKITDRSLRYLRHAQRLKSLDIAGTNVSAKGLATLRSMKNLRRLSITGAWRNITRYTSEDVEALQRALPDCEIVQD